MNKIKLTITAIALTLCATSFAQELSKKEKKKLQKEMLSKAKSMDPSALKTMFDEYPNLSSEVSSLNSQVSTLESAAVQKDGKISSLQADLDAANEKTLNMPTATASGGGTSSASRQTGKIIPGLIYKVQIGAFINKDLTKYFNSSSNFSGEVDQDGTKKYSIGKFTEYWEADSFKKYMREMGVKDAWIVPYFNGKRITMKDAREGAL